MSALTKNIFLQLSVVIPKIEDLYLSTCKFLSAQCAFVIRIPIYYNNICEPYLSI